MCWKRRGCRKHVFESETVSSFSAVSDDGKGIIAAQYVCEEPVLTNTMCVRQNRTGARFCNQYRILRVLGQGSFGRVYLVEADGRSYAMKVFHKSSLRKKKFYVADKVYSMLDTVQGEIEVLKLLKHERIVRLFEVIDDPEGDKVCLILEYSENGPCMSGKVVNEPLALGTARSYFYDLIEGIEYLQSLKIAHRDIKPENLLLTSDNKVKIADFGLAICYAKKECNFRKNMGTAAFAAPELCKEGDVEIIPEAIDLWAAGITLWMFVFGSPPFIGTSVMLTFEKILTDDLPFPSDLDLDLKDLLLGILNKDAKARFSIAQIKEHAWMK